VRHQLRYRRTPQAGASRLVSPSPGCLAPGVETITAALTSSDGNLPEVAVRVERTTLGLRSWRAVAEDGVAFRFELAVALRHGAAIFQSPAARYVINQQPEPLLEISLNLPPSAAAGIGWAIGNSHLPLAAEPGRMLTPDAPETRALLDRLKVVYVQTIEVFRPGRFARNGQPPSDLGPGHGHTPDAKPAQ